MHPMRHLPLPGWCALRLASLCQLLSVLVTAFEPEGKCYIFGQITPTTARKLPLHHHSPPQNQAHQVLSEIFWECLLEMGKELRK